MRRRDPVLPPLDGVLVLDKELGMSSARAVQIARRRAQFAKSGHAGTLDPLATGVLVVGMGRGTKAIERLMATEKGYDAEIDLSAFTPCDDREGERQEVAVERPPAREEVEAALRRFEGEIDQRPPAFSAMWVDGRRAYRIARKDDTLELPARKVVVHRVALEEYAWPIARVSLRCGKGFYVRSLARDLGRALGTGGHLASLRRTAVGPFTIDMARTLGALPEVIDASSLIPLDHALALVGGATGD
ncbi:MAG: tRNA pseudouridine(55) synthase TruB [Planctomycetaceae bacterium]|nr:tRNA pseudouridine(55) synthase TruB [Planctomycetaceae bacterium]